MRNIGNGAIVLGNAINRDHPLNRGLESLWLPLQHMSGNVLPDLCNRNNGAFATNAPTYSGGFGKCMQSRALKFDGTNDYINCGTNLSAKIGGDQSLFVSVVLTSNGNGGYVCGDYNSALNANSMAIRLAAANITANCNNGSAVLNLGAGVTTYYFTNICVTRTGSSGSWSISLFVERAPGFSLNKVTTTTATNPSPQSFSIGRPGAYNGLYIAGYVFGVGVWSKRLTDSDVASLFSESRRGYPTMLNRLSPLRTFYFASTGAAAYTLSCSTGSYAVTGTATSLLFGRKIALAIGSYTLSGTTTSLLRSRKIFPDVGSYSLTGVDPSLEFGRLISLAVGSYTVTGIDPTLIYTPTGAYTLACNTGNYSYTGINPSLRYARRVYPDTGSYSLAGTSTGLLFGRKIFPDIGSYQISGVSTSLLKGWKLLVDSGNYSLTGVDPGLLYHRIVVAATGSYTLSGTSVTLTTGVAVVLPAHPFLGGNVSYVVRSSTGSSFVTLVHSGASYIG